MPYIEPAKRPVVDEKLAPLITYFKSLPVEEQDGAINYSVTRILKKVYPLRYFHLNRALGVLTAIKEEFYRRVVAPYEDIKIKDNGDV
jgi:hypothetical protein